MPYIGKSPSAGVRQRYQYTATAGQTTFSGTDLGNLTFTYTDNNFVDVFQNGVLLKGGGTDYTATSGTSVVLATGASVSDVIEIIVYDVFSVGNFFNRTDSDSRYVNVDGDTMTGEFKANGGAVFNEDSADVDFRVESNGQTHALFVDGGNDHVNINTSSDLGSTLNLNGNAISSISSNGGNIVAYRSSESDGDYGGVEFHNHPSSTTGYRKGAIYFESDGNGFGRADMVFCNDGTGDANNVAIADERMRITSAGNIALGNTGSTSNISTSILITATGNGSHDDHFWFFGPHYTGDDPSYYVINHSSVGVYLSYGGNSWSAHSDERIKENITPLENVLPDIKNIRCVKYNLKGQPTTKIGFIAQDWESKFSEVVDENSRQVIESDGTVAMDTESESTTKVKAISYTETIPVLLKAIQELSAKNDALEARIKKLEDG